jgi:hypothetical protein
MSIKDTIWLLAHSQDNEDKREWAVLYWKYRGVIDELGHTHQVISKRLFKSKNWVQRYMTRIYKRFNTPPIQDPDEKFQWLVDNVFPALKEFLEVDPEGRKLLPPPLEMIDEDPPGEPLSEPPEEEKGPIVTRIPAPLSYIPPQPRRPPYLALALISVCLLGIAVVSFIAWRYYPMVAAIATNNALTPQIQVITASPAPLPATTAPPVVLLPPTNTLPPPTPAVPMATIPTPTLTLAVPADGILFQDNFDNGLIKPDWKLDNAWIIADGALSRTSQNYNDPYSWSTLNEPAWKNYIVSVKINIPFMGSAAQSPVVVAVRVNGQAKYLGVEIPPFIGNALYFIGNDVNDSVAVAQSRVFDFESGYTLEIEANGNNFIVRINGRQVQQVSLSGYDSGGIALGMICGSGLGCPSFDDVKVTYLP